jgi:hypothetical protein
MDWCSTKQCAGVSAFFPEKPAVRDQPSVGVRASLHCQSDGQWGRVERKDGIVQNENDTGARLASGGNGRKTPNTP